MRKHRYALGATFASLAIVLLAACQGNTGSSGSQSGGATSNLKIGLVTDVIVGFPGESEAAYLNTRALVEEMEFDVVHIAMYSPRPGTFAATRMDDDVPHAEKLRRLNDLLALQRGIAARKTARWLGRDVEVLIEGRDELNRPFGRIRQGKRAIVMRSGEVAPGEVLNVRVVQATAGQLLGLPAA